MDDNPLRLCQWNRRLSFSFMFIPTLMSLRRNVLNHL